MKNKELFTKTVNILVDAYFKNTLKHGDCAACAVGNIIRGNGMQLCMRGDDIEKYYTKSVQWLRHIKNTIRKDEEPQECDVEIALEQINITGYSIEELNIIEKAFENPEIFYDGNDYMFNGLMAVVDVLIEIHEGNETEKVTAKELFTV